MYRDLVEKRGWITEGDYKEGMALAQLMPGPLAAQLAIYLGYVHYRVLGATLVGIAFVLPSFLMVVAIGAAYAALVSTQSDKAQFGTTRFGPAARAQCLLAARFACYRRDGALAE